MRGECEICCSAPVVLHACRQCGYRTCRRCSKRVALAHAAARCAKCEREWDVRECHARLGKAFVRTVYRPHVRRGLLARETARLHESEAQARHERQRRFLAKEIRRLFGEMRATGQWHALPQLQATRLALRALLDGSPAAERPQGARAFARCAHAGCAGVVLDDGACGVCLRRTCARCGAPAHDGPCREEEVRSLECLRATARPCAGCGAPSVRAEGCPVMWCPQCRAFWHWDQRRVIHTSAGAAPHNPDHRAWLAARSAPPRELHDLPCGGFPDANAVHRRIVAALAAERLGPGPGPGQPRYDAVLPALEAMQHAQLVLRPRYPRGPTDGEALARLRVAYLLGDLRGDDDYARCIEAHERVAEMKREVAAVLEWFVLAGLDVLQRFDAADPAERIGGAEAVASLRALRALVQAALGECASVWQRKAPALGDDWQWRVPYLRAR